jgi:hypothetical protein
LEYFPERNKILYFSKAPVEAYHLNSNGTFSLAEVYNPLKSATWIVDKSILTVEDYERIEKRLDTFLREVVKDAKLNGIPNSSIFWSEPFNKVICKSEKPNDKS